MTRFYLLVIINMALLQSCKTIISHAQSNTLDSTIATIQKQIAKGEWDKAETDINELRSTPVPKMKEPDVFFITGYFYQVKSAVASDSAAEQGLLQKSLIAYESAHRLVPGNASINQNIAILQARLNNHAQAITYMKAAYQQEKSPAYSVYIGDLYLQDDRYDSALYFYKKTVSTDPHNQHAYECIRYLYSQQSPAPEEVMSLCEQMSNNGFASISSDLLADLIQRFYNKEDQQKIERAFMWWVYLLGKNKTGNDDVQKVFGQTNWNHQGFRQLTNVWTFPRADSTLDWWQNAAKKQITANLTVTPSQVIVSALQVLARQLTDNGNTDAGVHIYERAFNMIAPRNEEAVVTGGTTPDEYFDAAGNLGIAYVKYPQLDQQGIKFKRLENVLLTHKGEAYRTNNREAKAKFHTTLGLIYATKKEWTASDPYNAIYQLEHAIQNSPQTKNTGPLKLLLADGYVDIGNLDSARNKLIFAASDYLNDDNLVTASQVLAKFEALQGNKQGSDFLSVSKILDFRKKINSLDFSSVTFQSLNSEIEDITKKNSSLPEEFYKLQRFKILSDCGTRAAETSDAKATEFFHIKALNQADDVNTIGNINDANRLNQQQKTIKQNVQFKNSDTPGIKKSQGNTEKVKTWNIKASESSDPEQFKMNKDILVGAQLKEILNDHQAKTPSDQKPTLTINGANNLIEVQHNEAQPDQLRKQLQKPAGESGMTLKMTRRKE